MIGNLRKIALAWAASWLFLLWSALCVCIGAAWMLVALVGVLRAEGVL